MKKLLAILFMSAVVFTACESEKKDEKKVDLTPEDASVQIEDIAEDINTDVAELAESNGVQIMEEFFNLFDGFESFEDGREEKRSWLKKKLAAISDAFVKKPISRLGNVNDDDITFDDIKGTWEWNPTSKEFDKKGESDFFILLFPSENSPSNNAKLTITALEFDPIVTVDDGETSTYQEPSKVVGNVKIDDKLAISADLSIVWKKETGYPVAGNATIDMTPFSMSVSFSDTEPKQSKASYSLKKNNNLLVGFDVDATFSDEKKDDVTKVKGFVTYSNLKIQGSVDPTYEWDENDEKITSDLNEYVDLSVLIDDSKVGDITFDKGNLAYVKYEDGKEVLVEELIEKAIKKIEASIEEFEGAED